MKTNRVFIVLVIFAMALSACGPGAEEMAATSVAETDEAATATPTFTPTPAPTLTPTEKPSEVSVEPGSVVGRVYWEEKGMPIVGVQINLRGAEIITDADGKFGFYDLEPGVYRISVSGQLEFDNKSAPPCLALNVDSLLGGLWNTTLWGEESKTDDTVLLILMSNLDIEVKAGEELILDIPFHCNTPIPYLQVPADYATIQEAIDAAEDGDEIIVSPGRYAENIDFNGKNIILRSSDPEDPEVVAATIIDGGRKGSVVTFKSGETTETVLAGFTITNGSGSEYEHENKKFILGGGIVAVDNSSPTIVGNIISGNVSNIGGGIGVIEASPIIIGNTIFGNRAHERDGGGIFVYSNASPTIEGNEIRENEAVESGGGIFVLYNSSPIIHGNTINNNQAGYGGGIYVKDNSSPPITENTINENRAIEGGGLYVAANSSPLIQNNTINNNSVIRGGGGIFVYNNSSAEIVGNTISENETEKEAGFGGGGIFIQEASPTIEENTISKNESYVGGGIVVMESSSMIENNSIIDNVAIAGGGIIVVYSSSPTLKGNTITGNEADTAGGVYVQAGSKLILDDPDDNIYEDNEPDDIYIEP